MTVSGDSSSSDDEIEMTEPRPPTSPPPPPPTQHDAQAKQKETLKENEPSKPKKEKRNNFDYSEDRDVNQLNHSLRLQFSDVFAEPEPSLYSLNEIWTVSEVIFKFVRTWTYRVLTIVFAIPIVILSAFILALWTALYIWVLMPLFQLLRYVVHPVHMVLMLVLNKLVIPSVTASGYVLSKIRLTQVRDGRAPPPFYDHV